MTPTEIFQTRYYKILKKSHIHEVLHTQGWKNSSKSNINLRKMWNPEIKLKIYVTLAAQSHRHVFLNYKYPLLPSLRCTRKLDVCVSAFFVPNCNNAKLSKSFLYNIPHGIRIYRVSLNIVFFQEFSKVCHLSLASTRLLLVVQPETANRSDCTLALRWELWRSLTAM